MTAFHTVYTVIWMSGHEESILFKSLGEKNNGYLEKYLRHCSKEVLNSCGMWSVTLFSGDAEALMSSTSTEKRLSQDPYNLTRRVFRGVALFCMQLTV